MLGVLLEEIELVLKWGVEGGLISAKECFGRGVNLC